MKIKFLSLLFSTLLLSLSFLNAQSPNPSPQVPTAQGDLREVVIDLDQNGGEVLVVYDDGPLWRHVASAPAPAPSPGTSHPAYGYPDSVTIPADVFNTFIGSVVALDDLEDFADNAPEFETETDPGGTTFVPGTGGASSVGIPVLIPDYNEDTPEKFDIPMNIPPTPFLGDRNGFDSAFDARVGIDIVYIPGFFIPGKYYADEDELSNYKAVLVIRSIDWEQFFAWLDAMENFFPWFDWGSMPEYLKNYWREKLAQDPVVPNIPLPVDPRWFNDPWLQDKFDKENQYNHPGFPGPIYPPGTAPPGY